jgi:hypothetical protein
LYPCRSFNSSEEQLLIAGKLLQLAAADERETETESVLLFLFNSLDFFCGWKLFRKCYRSSSGDSSGAFSLFGGPHYENRGTNRCRSREARSDLLPFSLELADWASSFVIRVQSIR